MGQAEIADSRAFINRKNGVMSKKILPRGNQLDLLPYQSTLPDGLANLTPISKAFSQSTGNTSFFIRAFSFGSTSGLTAYFMKSSNGDVSLTKRDSDIPNIIFTHISRIKREGTSPCIA